MRYFLLPESTNGSNKCVSVRVVKKMDVLRGHMRCIQFDVFSVVKRRWLV